MKKKSTPAPRRSGTALVDVTEWSELGKRLAIAGPEKYEEILDALRKIVDAQETIASFDWQLLFGVRPTKRYQA